MMANEVERSSSGYAFAIALMNTYIRCRRKHLDFSEKNALGIDNPSLIALTLLNNSH